MNLKKYVLTLLILLCSFNISKAQKIEKVKTLYFIFGNQEYPAVRSDSIMVSKTSNDTTWFNTSASYPSGQGFYYRAGQKVYKKESTKEILLYDYSLNAGDSIIIHTSAFLHDTFKVDSVYFKKMSHRTFKAWHLTVKHHTSGYKYMEWVEGLGELRRGWDSKHYFFTDGGWEIKGMCLNDSVIYWDSAFNYFKERNPSPTCMFDSVSKRLSIEKPVNSEIFNFYPNPVSDVLTFSSSSGGSMHIIDYTGKVCLENIIFKPGTQTIDLATLKPGVYIAAIQMDNKIIYRPICVARP